jgi:hypothetical protein
MSARPASYVVAVLLSATPQSAVRAVDLSAADIAKRATPAVVVIRAETVDGSTTGSGFIVDPSGTIITNLHVIRGAKAAAVKLASGDVYDQVRIRAFDERKDLAIIQVSGFGLPVLPLGNSDTLQPGQNVVLVGNPLGLEASVSSGIVSGIRTTEAGFTIIQTDAAANPGNSGGPMIAANGEVVGVLTFKLKGAESLNFVVPINYARGMLASSESLSLLDLEQRLGKSTDLFTSKAPVTAIPERWRSLASGTRKVLRVDGEHLYIETILPAERQRPGDFLLAELKKVGDSYVGRNRVSLTCSWNSFTPFVGWQQKENRCADETEMEITLLSPTRIEGRAMESGGTGATFDCKKCRWSRPAQMMPFTWIPEDGRR